MKKVIGNSVSPDSVVPSVITVRCKEGVFGTDHRSESDYKRGRHGHHLIRFAGNALHPADAEMIRSLRKKIVNHSTSTEVLSTIS